MRMRLWERIVLTYRTKSAAGNVIFRVAHFSTRKCVIQMFFIIIFSSTYLSGYTIQFLLWGSVSFKAKRMIESLFQGFYDRRERLYPIVFCVLQLLRLNWVAHAAYFCIDSRELKFTFRRRASKAGILES